MSFTNKNGFQMNTLVMHRILDDSIMQFEDINSYIFKSIFEIPCIKLLSIDSALEYSGKGNVVCLTFDDGFSSDWEIVFPVLQEHGASATFYVVTDWIGKSGYLTKSQIREMKDAGMQIGSHSHTHPDFRILDSDNIRHELTYSRQTLEDIVGGDITTFSFPFGYETTALAHKVFKMGYRNFLSYHQK